MNLLVTGGCGFIASNFINHYYYSNPTVTIINIDAMYYCADEQNVLPEIRQDSFRYIFIKGNICSGDLIGFILQRYDITHIIHFAAQSHVHNSFEDSLQFTADNIVGTHTLLDCARKYGQLQKFIHVSTDEVYGESMLSDAVKKTEESVLCPTNPYAATKAGAELIAQSYYHSFKLPIIITRGNNVYGKNQYPEKLIPKFIHFLLHQQKLTIDGDGTSRRAFLHVDDVCNAFQIILEQGAIGEIYNIGSDEHHEYSVMEIANMLVQHIVGQEALLEEWIEYVPDRPFNDKRYYINNDKLKNLGWTIQKPFTEGLCELIDWTRQQLHEKESPLNTLKLTSHM